MSNSAFSATSRWKQICVGGEIRRYGLEDWWLSSFTMDEREAIAALYSPLGEGTRPLVEGDCKAFPMMPIPEFLANLATWTSKPASHDLAIKIADKAASYPLPDDPWSAHYTLANLCRVFYRWRDEIPGCLEKAIKVCEMDIDLSSKLGEPITFDGIRLQSHCHKQLAIIEEKRDNLEQAIAVSRTAIKQGWAGDWEKRIARLEKRLAKARN